MHQNIHTFRCSLPRSRFAEHRLIAFEGMGKNPEMTQKVADTSLNLLREQMTPEKLKEAATRIADSAIQRGGDLSRKLTGRLSQPGKLRNKITGSMKDTVQAGVGVAKDVTTPYVAEVGARIGEKEARDRVPFFKDRAGKIGAQMGRTAGAEAVDNAGTVAEQSANTAIDGTAGKVLNGDVAGGIGSAAEIGTKTIGTGVKAAGSILGGFLKK